MDATNKLQPLMTPAEVAGVLRVPTDTLAHWRIRKPDALPFVRLKRDGDTLVLQADPTAEP